MKRLLSGIKPTGDLTLGNYIGALKHFNEMQKEYETFVFVADLHALTIYNDPKVLHKKIRDLIAVYLACGLDPKYTTLFIQSENVYHANLSWVFECNTYMGEAARMTQFKEKSKNNENVTVGLFTYPMLMASDILLYDADVVPVGIDQKQHVELARNIAERFNNKYGETFKIPEPVIPKTGAKIYDLQDPTKKMSKSDDNNKGCIILLEDPEIARKKIMSAVTDSEMSIKFDPEHKPGVSNLLTIYSSLKNISIQDAEKEFEGSNYGTFKKRVADVVVELLNNLQSKYKEVIEGDTIDKILDESNKKVREIAKSKVEEVFTKVGVGR
ncbi:MAG: tryptophan--tRNA ligase [Bacilli bacterium]|nr:tryptophan--tRNA ligase [Bacilli bacterium]